MLKVERLSVPAVRVTAPVKVEVVVLSLSVKLPVPLIVVVPVTANVLVVPTVRVPEETAKAPATDRAPVVVNAKPPDPLTVRAPKNATAAEPLIVVPPTPLNVKAPEPVIEILLDDQVMAVVAVIVLAVAVAKVTFGTLKVPAV